MTQQEHAVEVALYNLVIYLEAREKGYLAKELDGLAVKRLTAAGRKALDEVRSS